MTTKRTAEFGISKTGRPVWSKLREEPGNDSVTDSAGKHFAASARYKSSLDSLVRADEALATAAFSWRV